MSIMLQRLLAVAPTRGELVPWTDRRGRLHPLRATIFGLLLLPGLWLAFRWFTHDLGPEPVNAAIHSTGYWTIWLLLASLVVTPLKALSGLPNIAVIRRMVGNAALFYVLIHLTLYSMDQHWRMLTVASEILKRFYLTIGFVSLCGLAVLGLTSTDAWMRSLGRAWKRLHRLVYGVVVLGLVHYLLQSKLDVSQSLLAGGVFTWLALWRLLPAGRDRQLLPLLGISVASTVFTLAYEYGWYALGTHVNPTRVFLSEFDVTFGLHPAGKVLLLTLAASALTELRRLWMQYGDRLWLMVLAYGLGAFVLDGVALFFGWAWDDFVPDGTSPLMVDAIWVGIFAVLAVIRWAQRDRWFRHLPDGLWLASIAAQVVLAGPASRSLGTAGAVFVIGIAILLSRRPQPLSRATALALVPLALLLAYKTGGWM